MKTLVLTCLAVLGLLLAMLAFGLALGGPVPPQPLGSVNDAFDEVDFSNVPAPQQVLARDGTPLIYRAYRPARGKSACPVVLVHGSSAWGRSLHPMAQALAEAGHAVYVPDVRGHGGSGPRGQVGHIGQLEEDLEDLVAAWQLPPTATLVGFSAGGGLALRLAGSERAALFSGYVLLAPFVGHDAPTYRAGGGGWVNVGMPRVVALTALNAVGIRAFNHLPVTRFALDDEASRVLTPTYDYNLAMNFRPRTDWAANVRAVSQPLQVVVGADDEVFQADQFDGVFASHGHPGVVRVVPGVGHMGLTLEASALEEVVASVASLPCPSAKQAQASPK
ncbi:MAG: alpha/beta hydrolase [Polaromonas sp.]|nr:alpha/beta hydrolase [Polaromonas sp.]